MHNDFHAKLNKLVRKYFSDDESEVVEYGITVLISKFIFLITIVIVGVFCGELVSVLIFTLFYMPLRSFAGGIHAKTHLRCYFFSLAMLILTALIFKFIKITKLFFYLSIVYSAMILIILSPVEDLNKPLDEMEIKIYRKKSLLIWCIEATVGVIITYFSFDLLYSCIFLNFTILSVMLILGKIKNKIICSKNKNTEEKENEAETKSLS